MHDRDKIIEKIAKLLRLSKSSNEHEAALALARAHELLQKHNLSMAEIKDESPISRDRFRAGQSFNDEYDFIALLLREFFDVQFVHINTRGVRFYTGVEYWVCGEKHAIMIGEHVFHYLSSTFRRLWKKRSPDLVSKRMKKTTIARIRKGYYLGLASSIRRKLRESV
jgi:hypothetical protein